MWRLVTLGKAKEVVELVVTPAAAPAGDPRRAVPGAPAGRAARGARGRRAWSRSSSPTPTSATTAAPGCGPPRSTSPDAARVRSWRWPRRSRPPRRWRRTPSGRQHVYGASAVYLAEPDGTVVAAADPTARGDRSTSATAACSERRAWSGDVDDRGRRSIAAQVPVLDDDGELIGDRDGRRRTTPSLERPGPQRAARPARLPRARAGCSVSPAPGCWPRLIKRRTRGLEPAEIAALADQREALLHSIREGVVAVGRRRAGHDDQRQRPRPARAARRRRRAGRWPTSACEPAGARGCCWPTTTSATRCWWSAAGWWCSTATGCSSEGARSAR